jgi:hypothetical protein
MRAPGRGAFKDVITDLLQQQDELGQSQKEFLQRLRDDDANRIDKIWEKFVEKQPELIDDDRPLFIEYLTDVWTVIVWAQYEAADKRLRYLGGILEARMKRYWAKRFVNAPPDELPKILKEMEYFSRENEARLENPLSDFFQNSTFAVITKGHDCEQRSCALSPTAHGRLLGIGAMTKSLP